MVKGKSGEPELSTRIEKPGSRQTHNFGVLDSNQQRQKIRRAGKSDQESSSDSPIEKLNYKTPAYTLYRVRKVFGSWHNIRHIWQQYLGLRRELFLL